MPLCNRVLPTGEIVAAPWRGALTGNRGILHGDDGRMGRARWRHPNWIACRLEWKGVRRVPMSPGTWTELFFWDEAAAMAAGHRPCAYCRRADWLVFREAWVAAGLPGVRAGEIDRVLHGARLGPAPGRAQRRFRADAGALPDGVFVAVEGAVALLARGRLWRFDGEAGGYVEAGPVPGQVEVLTPAPLVAVLGQGYPVGMRLV